MNTAHRLLLAAGLVILSGVVSVVAAPALPAQLITHWNAAGQPDGTMSKAVGLAIVPVLSAVLLGLFVLIPRIDPLGENIAQFRPYYDWFVVIFAGYMLAIQAAIVAFNLGYTFDMTMLIVGAIAVLFYYVGVLLTHAERNWFVGIRTPWTLSSDEVWQRTHRLGGRLFKLTAILSAVGLLFGTYAIYFVVVPALLTATITVIYSYFVYEQIEGGATPTAESRG